MRKSTKVMAGLGVVAGLGIALAPLATFADAAGANTLTLNINSNCQIASGSNIISGTWSKTVDADDTTVTLDAPTSGGNATINFSCNQNSQVTVKAQPSALAGPNSSSIPVTSIQAKYSTTGSGMTLATGFDSYKYFVSADATTPVTIATGVAPASGNLGITVDGYKVDITDDLQAGTYTGTVTYTFANI